jgi:hypothetical protein
LPDCFESLFFSGKSMDNWSAGIGKQSNIKPINKLRRPRDWLKCLRFAPKNLKIETRQMITRDQNVTGMNTMVLNTVSSHSHFSDSGPVGSKDLIVWIHRANRFSELVRVLDRVSDSNVQWQRQG